MPAVVPVATRFQTRATAKCTSGAGGETREEKAGIIEKAVKKTGKGAKKKVSRAEAKAKEAEEEAEAEKARLAKVARLEAEARAKEAKLRERLDDPPVLVGTVPRQENERPDSSTMGTFSLTKSGKLAHFSAENWADGAIIDPKPGGPTHKPITQRHHQSVMKLSDNRWATITKMAKELAQEYIDKRRKKMKKRQKTLKEGEVVYDWGDGDDEPLLDSEA
ncbi:hypothetical protein NP233_g8337 [Leucocoprinus birnbaumii]|uniref:Uncharacterized protein n=1 Tax=Leucocoprinus birnbaumii TaxID=56174 RepID=A0AAD5VMR5_9AGAR|nr:hypothetical protein NP233_g8337 [Leucocoprinus birnbaumii]